MNEVVSATPEKRTGRRKWLVRAAAVLAILLVVQSVTITLPIRGRIVDKDTGRPISGAAVAALWELEAWTPVHALPGGAVKLAQAISDADGRFEFDAAFIVHTPLLPFSWLARSDRYMPKLVVVAEGYHALRAANDIFGLKGPPHGSGFLALRSSSLENVTLRLSSKRRSASSEERNAYSASLSMALNEIGFASGTCADRILCSRSPLTEVRAAIKRAQQRAQN